MSRTVRTSEYKLFVWDVGTDGAQIHQATIRTIAVMEYTNDTNSLAHFTTSVRPPNKPRPTEPRPTKSYPTDLTPSFPQAWREFKSFIANHSRRHPPLLVSHNAAFDVTILLTELLRLALKVPSHWRFACSLLLCRAVHPFGADNSQLAVALRLGVPVNRQHHTEEDVIVLRDILKALDERARRQRNQLHRVIPALFAAARKPASFDRTPQSSPKYYITHTGTKYHRLGCKWLQRTCIPRHTLPPGFEPCRICRPDNPQTTTNHTVRQRATPPIVEKHITSGFFISKAGNKYHRGECKRLSKSRIPVRNPPHGYKPCHVCNPPSGKLHKSKVRESTSPSLQIVSKSTKNASPASPVTEGRFFITKTGAKYHVEGCRSLGMSRIPKDEPPPGYGPCGICLPSRAYKGPPQRRMV